MITIPTPPPIHTPRLTSSFSLHCVTASLAIYTPSSPMIFHVWQIFTLPSVYKGQLL